MAARKYLFIAPLAVVVLASSTASAIAGQEAQSKTTQTIKVESTPPKPGLVGGTYVTKAKASSGLPVVVNTEESPSVCSNSGSTVTFKAPGTCHVDYNQPGNSEWEAAPEIKQFVEVKRTQTTTFKSTPPSPAFVGGTYAVEATASSGLAVALSSATPSVCTVSGSTVSLVAAGTCTVNANQAGNAEYTAAPQVAQSFSVSKRSQKITFASTAPSGATVGGPTYTVSATASSGLAVAISSGTPSVCTVSGTTVSFVGAGTCTINANQAGSTEYEPAPQEHQSFAVAKRGQTITFTSSPPSSPVVGGPTYTVSASASSGLAVSFSSATTKVCTVSGSTVTFVGAGGCTIVASQPGNGEYEAAAETTQTFVVTKRSQTITFKSTPPSPAFVGGTYQVEATASSGLTAATSSATPGVCTVSGTTISFVGAGTCTINANQAGNAEYEPAPQVQQSFAVSKRVQTVAITSTAPASATVGGPTYALTASASSGLPVSLSSGTEKVCTVSGSTVSFVGAGTCTVNANQAGNGEYEPAPQAQQAFSVAKGMQTITFTSSPPEQASVGQTYTVAATGGKSGNPVTFTDPGSETACAISGSTVKFTGAGTCTIKADQAGSEGYEAAPTVTQSVAVAKKKQTLSFTSSPPGKPAAGGTYTVSATATSGLSVAFSSATEKVCTVSASTVSFIAVGTCVINADQPGNAEWEPAAQAQQTVSPVGKGAQTIKFASNPPNPATYGGTYNVEASASSKLPVALSTSTPSVCTISGSTVSFVGAGECVILANQGGNENYEPAPQVPQPFAVGKASQTINKESTAGSTYVGGPTYTVKASASSGLPVVVSSATESVCTVSGSTVSFIAVGTCTIDLNQPGNANYSPAPQVVEELHVVKGFQAITFTTSPPSNAQIGGPTYEVKATGGASGNPVVITLDAASTGCALSPPSSIYFVANGECIIDANQAESASYNAAPQAQQKFAIGSSSTQVIVLPSKEGGPSTKSPPPIKQVGPVTVANSSFRVIGASLSLATFAITFQETVADPGAFSWVLTFENGKFGVYAAKKRCKSGLVRLKGKCRPSKVLFAKGSQTVVAAGTVTFTVRPTSAGIAAMKKAFKLHKGLPVTALVTFQSSRGGPPASRLQSLIVKGRR